MIHIPQKRPGNLKSEQARDGIGFKTNTSDDEATKQVTKTTIPFIYLFFLSATRHTEPQKTVAPELRPVHTANKAEPAELDLIRHQSSVASGADAQKQRNFEKVTASNEPIGGGWGAGPQGSSRSLHANYHIKPARPDGCDGPQAEQQRLRWTMTAVVHQ